MGLREDIIAAKKAADKLNAYSDGLAAAGGKDATEKYKKLNSIAYNAIKKLPDGFMRTREGLTLSALIAKKTGKKKKT